MPQTNSVQKPETSNGPARGQQNHTAIVYFHGIGTPRRLEEVSRLADAFDQFAELQEIGSVGVLRQIDVHWESSRAKTVNDSIAYISMTRIVKRFGWKYQREGTFRIYEGYWSSAVAGGFSAIRVFCWLFTNLLNPFLILSRPWRAHLRLKLTSLFRMMDSNRQTGDLQNALETLEGHYRSFESWPARRKYPKGNFSDFLSHIASSHRRNSALKAKITTLARKWRSAFLREQILLAFLSITVLVASFEAIVVVVSLVATALRFMFPELSAYPLIQSWQLTLPYPAVSITIIVTMLALVILRLRYYLRYFLADVMFWSTTDEKDIRFARKKEMVEAGEQLLRHVISDPQCNRIVVIGHSLGSAIAFQSLVNLGRSIRRGDALAEKRLGKIAYLVTVGSPIDRIHYFFELYQSVYHRFNRIFDRVQGSTDDPPFSANGVNCTPWINVWDDTDLISGRLFSPIRRSQNLKSVNNQLSRSSFCPNPISAHINYLVSEATLRTVFWISILNRMPPQRTLCFHGSPADSCAIQGAPRLR